jgi:hypothetical protein
MTLLEQFPQLRRIVELAKIDLGDKPGAGVCGPCEAPRRMYYPSVYISGREKPVDIPDKGKAVIEYRVSGRSMNKRGDEQARHSTDIEIHSIEPIEEEEEKGPKEGQAARLLGDLRKVTGFETKPVGGGIAAALREIARRNKSRGAGMVQKRYWQPKRTRRQPPFANGQERDPMGFGANAQRRTSNAQRPTFFDSRPRNENGQYIADQTGGADPNSMAAAYGPPGAEPVDAFTEPHIERVKRFFLGRRAL